MVTVAVQHEILHQIGLIYGARHNKCWSIQPDFNALFAAKDYYFVVEVCDHKRMSDRVFVIVLSLNKTLERCIEISLRERQQNLGHVGNTSQECTIPTDVPEMG